MPKYFLLLVILLSCTFSINAQDFKGEDRGSARFEDAPVPGYMGPPVGHPRKVGEADRGMKGDAEVGEVVMDPVTSEAMVRMSGVPSDKDLHGYLQTNLKDPMVTAWALRITGANKGQIGDVKIDIARALNSGITDVFLFNDVTELIRRKCVGKTTIECFSQTQPRVVNKLIYFLKKEYSHKEKVKDKDFGTSAVKEVTKMRQPTAPAPLPATAVQHREDASRTGGSSISLPASDGTSGSGASGGGT